MVPSAADPQSLNRYSYVRNNPLIRGDPSVHWDLSTYPGRQATRNALGQATSSTLSRFTTAVAGLCTVAPARSQVLSAT
ncbi:MAG: hypothetical protein JO352_20375 [Chloroflexi bacterium]|nr:hypothetical protein [Chloroflexota bacterium]